MLGARVEQRRRGVREQPAAHRVVALADALQGPAQRAALAGRGGLLLLALGRHVDGDRHAHPHVLRALDHAAARRARQVRALERAQAEVGVRAVALVVDHRVQAGRVPRHEGRVPVAQRAQPLGGVRGLAREGRRVAARRVQHAAHVLEPVGRQDAGRQHVVRVVHRLQVGAHARRQLVQLGRRDAVVDAMHRGDDDAVDVDRRGLLVRAQQARDAVADLVVRDDHALAVAVADLHLGGRRRRPVTGARVPGRGAPGP